MIGTTKSIQQIHLLWCHESGKKIMRDTNEINWNEMPDDYKFSPSLVLRCKEMVGEGKNVDIEMPTYVN